MHVSACAKARLLSLRVPMATLEGASFLVSLYGARLWSVLVTVYCTEKLSSVQRYGHSSVSLGVILLPPSPRILGVAFPLGLWPS